MKLRNNQADHHPWCNFFDRVGECKMCDRLEITCPVEPGDTEISLMKRYFPDNKVKLTKKDVENANINQILKTIL
jgi:hypothetical protein